jgi:hypothetical protein
LPLAETPKNSPNASPSSKPAKRTTFSNSASKTPSRSRTKSTSPRPQHPPPSKIAAWEKRVARHVRGFETETRTSKKAKRFFPAICASLPQVHGIGFTVGPDLDAEFQRAPEVILRDILFPSEAARPGYETMMVKTHRGETLLGITASDSPTSITLKLPGGQ